MATWKNNPDLMARLGKAQNHPANINQDVMSFAGMCDSREELERHVNHCEGRVLDADIAAIVKATFGKRRTSKTRGDYPLLDKGRWKPLKRLRQAGARVLVLIFVSGVVDPLEAAANPVPSPSEHRATAMAPWTFINDRAGKISLSVLRTVSVGSGLRIPIEVNQQYRVGPAYLIGDVLRLSGGQDESSEVVVPRGTQGAQGLQMRDVFYHNPAFKNCGVNLASVDYQVNNSVVLFHDITHNEMRAMCNDELLPSNLFLLHSDVGLIPLDFKLLLADLSEFPRGLVRSVEVSDFEVGNAYQGAGKYREQKCVDRDCVVRAPLPESIKIILIISAVVGWFGMSLLLRRKGLLP